MSYINFRSNPEDPMKEEMKRRKVAKERQDAELPDEFKKVEEIREKRKLELLKERFDTDSPTKVVFKSGNRVEVLSVREGEGVVEKKTEISEPVEEVIRADDVWIDEETAKEIGLDDYRSEEKFERLSDFKLSEIRKDKDRLIALSEEDKRQLEKIRKDYGNWREFVKKCEKKLDYELKFYPERIQFVQG